jgi:hypothetical protein
MKTYPKYLKILRHAVTAVQKGNSTTAVSSQKFCGYIVSLFNDRTPYNGRDFYRESRLEVDSSTSTVGLRVVSGNETGNQCLGHSVPGG